MTTQWALITGASAGIGRELARIFARAGYSLVLLARNAARLKDLAGELHSTHEIQTRVLPQDLARPEAAIETFESLRDTPISVLVNNAGFGSYGPFARTDLAVSTGMMQVNVLAPVQLTKLFLQPMLQRGA